MPSSRTAARIITEYRKRNCTPEYIRALAVAIGRQDVIDLLKQYKEGTAASALVTCKGCTMPVPFGEERFRAGKRYCEACYQQELDSANKEIEPLDAQESADVVAVEPELDPEPKEHRRRPKW